MKRIGLTLAVIMLAGGIFAGTAAPIFAGDGGCTEAGGTYDKDGPIASCSFPVGNSDNTKVTDQKGSFSSSHPSGYINPGGSRPPGQQE